MFQDRGPLKRIVVLLCITGSTDNKAHRIINNNTTRPKVSVDFGDFPQRKSISAERREMDLPHCESDVSLFVATGALYYYHGGCC